MTPWCYVILGIFAVITVVEYMVICDKHPFRKKRKEK